MIRKRISHRPVHDRCSLHASAAGVGAVHMVQQPVKSDELAAGWDPALLAQCAANKDKVAGLDGLMASDELKAHLK